MEHNTDHPRRHSVVVSYGRNGVTIGMSVPAADDTQATVTQTTPHQLDIGKADLENVLPFRPRCNVRDDDDPLKK